MNTCEYRGEAFTEARSHPCTDAASSSEFRYYDLKASPALIRTSLEDYVPWSRFGAIERFYQLLEWLHGASSRLESNDCEFSPPHANESSQVRAAFECSGRVMVLFRELSRNVSRHELLALTNAFHHALAPLDSEFERGMVGTTLVPVRYVTLARGKSAQLGQQLMLSFWAWGDTEAETMHNLERLMANLTIALQRVAV